MRLAIVGTGKMARDLGAFYMGRGAGIVVASADGGRLRGAVAELERRHARLVKIAPGSAPPAPPAGLLLPCRDAPEVDFVIETTAESLAAKRAALGAAGPLLRPARAVATNSSSLLPGEILDGIAGAHHFFPAALTGILELVADGSTPGPAIAALRELAAFAGLSVIEEGEANAFAVNRLLLPLQDEAFRALRAGLPAARVEEASISPLCGAGALSLVDAVGIDTVAASVERYCARMTGGRARSLAGLRAGLAELLAAGKLGRKNGDGLLLGGPLPWAPREDRDRERALGPRMRAVFHETCARFLGEGELTEAALDLALGRVLGAQVRFGDARAMLAPSGGGAGAR